MDINGFTKRLQNLITHTGTEWGTIEKEGHEWKRVFSTYALPLIFLMGLSYLVGYILFTDQLIYSFGYILISSIAEMIIALAGTLLTGYIINELAPGFKGKKDLNASMKLVMFSFTAYYVSYSLAGLIQPMQVLQLGAFYSIYLYWFGCEALLFIPSEQKTGFVALSGLLMIVVFSLLNILSVLVFSDIMLHTISYM